MTQEPFTGKVVNRSVRKVDSLALAQGKPLYVADLDTKPLIINELYLNLYLISQ